MSTKEHTKIITRRVTRFGRKPTTGYQALRQARDLLAEEGRFCKMALFRDGSPESAYRDPQAAMCGDWQACSVGALGLVTGVLQPAVMYIRDAIGNRYEDWYGWEDLWVNNTTPAFNEAMELLAEAIAQHEKANLSYISADGVVYRYNDSKRTTRDDVLARFDEAMALGRKRSR